jgi:hypothetical protein
MQRVLTNKEGIIEEPCVSCEKCYVEDIWNEFCCDERQCIYPEAYLVKESELIESERYG